MSVHLVDEPPRLHLAAAEHSDLLGMIRIRHPNYEIPDSFTTGLDRIIGNDGLHLISQRRGKLTEHDKRNAIRWKRKVGSLTDMPNSSYDFVIMRKTLLA
ncbi:MAG: hypothetical protein HGA31_03065 [Candidatus Moranbacteria bacterium]|nr:hypothetical protein [Candidatus Moranbacteria bacterium]